MNRIWPVALGRQARSHFVGSANSSSSTWS